MIHIGFLVEEGRNGNRAQRAGVEAFGQDLRNAFLGLFGCPNTPDAGKIKTVGLIR